MSDEDEPKSDSDPPSEEEREVTGIHDIPRPMRPWARSQSHKLRKVEKHFEKGGMVHELASDWNAVTKSFNFWIKVGPILGAILVAGIGALMWIIHASVATQPPPPPSAQDVAREVLKQQKQ
jgi:hypothetical protein